MEGDGGDIRHEGAECCERESCIRAALMVFGDFGHEDDAVIQRHVPHLRRERCRDLGRRNGMYAPRVTSHGAQIGQGDIDQNVNV